jgi:hypothetical protein
VNIRLGAGKGTKMEGFDHSDTTAVIETLNELEKDVLQLMEGKERDEEGRAIQLLGYITWLRRSLVS